MVIYLVGDLGAGKTTLVRALLRALGYTGKVRSPTFTLAELYAISNFVIYHFDFYRFADSREWIDAGFRDFFTDETVCLVEWPEKAGALLPAADVHVALDFEGEGRSARLTAGSAKGWRCLERLKRESPPPG